MTDGCAEGLLEELIVRLIKGCLPNDAQNDVSTFNYQMFLRRLFRKKCQVSFIGKMMKKSFFFQKILAQIINFEQQNIKFEPRHEV